MNDNNNNNRRAYSAENSPGSRQRSGAPLKNGQSISQARSNTANNRSSSVQKIRIGTPASAKNRKSAVVSSGKKAVSTRVKKQPAKKSAFLKKNNDDIDDNGKGRDGTVLPSLLKAIIYIMFILVAAGFISYFTIAVGNDVFALVKSDEQVQVEIGEGLDIKELGKVLSDNGLIKYPKIFDFYAKLKKKNVNVEFVAGEYTASPSMSYDELIALFAKKIKTTKETVVVVVPEGYTINEIIDLLVNKHKLSSKEELTDAIQNYDFDYWFVKQLKVNSERKYRLEGYLYPDTYYFFSDSNAAAILYKFLDNFDKKMKATFGSGYQETIATLCAERNMSFDDIVILASMIQMEAKYDVEYGEISSVFNNRIKNPSATDGLLGSDATLQYILEKRTADLTKEQLAIDSPYNTRINRGLPPGPISNPTYLAINYAFYPADTNYYYFVSQADGYSLFASTYAQHQQNVKEVNENK